MSYEPALISTALKMLTFLFLVVGGSLTLLYVKRLATRRDQGRPKEKLIRVLGNSSLGVKKSISMVEIPGAVLVLGITADNVSLLSKIEDEETLRKLKSIGDEKPVSPFSDHLQRLSARLKTLKIERG